MLDAGRFGSIGHVLRLRFFLFPGKVLPEIRDTIDAIGARKRLLQAFDIIEIRLDDLRTLRRLGERVREAMQGVAGVADLSLEQQTDVPFIRFILNRPMVARYGLHPADVAEAIETSFAGATVGRTPVDRLSSLGHEMHKAWAWPTDFPDEPGSSLLARQRCGW